MIKPMERDDRAVWKMVYRGLAKARIYNKAVSHEILPLSTSALLVSHLITILHTARASIVPGKSRQVRVIDRDKTAEETKTGCFVGPSLILTQVGGLTLVPA